jgi:hypothetical protein
MPDGLCLDPKSAGRHMKLLVERKASSPAATTTFQILLDTLGSIPDPPRAAGRQPYNFDCPFGLRAIRQFSIP